MMKNKKALLSISLITLMGGLAISQMPKDFSVAFASGTVTIQGSYCSTSADLFQDVLFFEMLPNDAPFRGDEIRYRPQSNDCVSITRDGVTTNLSTNRGWDMIAKTSETRYTLETWMMGVLGDYKPRHGDIYTIKGNFTSRDTTGDDSDNIDGKYILNIKETGGASETRADRRRFPGQPQDPDGLPEEGGRRLHRHRERRRHRPFGTRSRLEERFPLRLRLFGSLDAEYERHGVY